MARPRRSPEGPAGPPSLRVPAAKAAAKIQAQINEGEALLQVHPSSDAQLEKLRDDRRVWSDYNHELLNQIFTTSSIADEYSAFYGASFSMDPSFTEKVGYVRDDIQDSLTRLRSIYRRIELFSAPEAVSHPAAIPARAEPPGNSVFLVHGHDDAAKQAVARFLERLGLSAIILHEQPDKGRTIIEKFEDHASVGYAVVLITGDDVGGSRESPETLQVRGRQNVILELGYFLGALGRTRVCALKEDGVEVPSDLSGVLYVPLDAAGAWRLRLAAEIKAAGLQVDLNQAI